MIVTEPTLANLLWTLLGGVIGIHFIRNARRGGEAAARWTETTMSSGAEHSNANINSALYFLVGVAIVLVVLYTLVIDFAVPWIRRGL